MIHRCMSTNQKFIIATSFENYLNPILVNHNRSLMDEESKAQSLEYGVLVHITECIPLPDGRSMIKAKVVKRIKLENIRFEESTIDLLYASFQDFSDMDSESNSVSQDTLSELCDRLLLKADEYLKLRGLSLQKFAQEPLESFDLVSYSLWLPGIVHPDRNFQIRSFKSRAFLSASIVERYQISLELLDQSISLERRSRNLRSLAMIIIILFILYYSTIQ
jgi:Lon protease-like protein